MDGDGWRTPARASTDGRDELTLITPLSVWHPVGSRGQPLDSSRGVWRGLLQDSVSIGDATTHVRWFHVVGARPAPAGYRLRVARLLFVDPCSVMGGVSVETYRLT